MSSGFPPRCARLKRVDTEHLDDTQRTTERGDPRLRFLGAFEIPAALTDHENAAGTFCRCDHVIAVRRADREWLLDEHVLAVLQRVDRKRTVQVIGHRENDGINFRIVEDRIGAGHGLEGTVFLGEFARAFLLARHSRDGNEFGHVPVRVDRGEMGNGDAARTDQANPQFPCLRRWSLCHFRSFPPKRATLLSCS